MVTVMSCHDFGAFVNYDPWVVPHQLLPSIALVIGLKWWEIVIAMYGWETLEQIMGCMSVRFESGIAESSSNSLISDPLQCFIGIVVAMVLMNVTDTTEPLVLKRLHAFLWSALFITPAIAIIINGVYVWGYIPTWILALVVLVKVNGDVKTSLFFYLVLYCSLVSISVFLLKDTFNSFYAAAAGAAFVIALVIIIKNV
jgi:hypothetical protein